jgi:hypothetical protein
LGQAIAKSRHDHSITRRPLHPLDLTLQNLNLPAECKNLSLQLGAIATPGYYKVQQDAKHRIDQRSLHAGAKS